MAQKEMVYVTRVIDGDTFEGDVPFLVLGHMMMLYGEKFRLKDINAPEREGSTRKAGDESRDYLKSLIEGKTVTVETELRDSFGRWVVTVYLGNLEINTHMVLKGYAETKIY